MTVGALSNIHSYISPMCNVVFKQQLFISYKHYLEAIFNYYHETTFNHYHEATYKHYYVNLTFFHKSCVQFCPTLPDQESNLIFKFLRIGGIPMMNYRRPIHKLISKLLKPRNLSLDKTETCVYIPI